MQSRRRVAGGGLRRRLMVERGGRGWAAGGECGRVRDDGGAATREKQIGWEEGDAGGEAGVYGDVVSGVWRKW